jgi:hypothetical protein
VNLAASILFVECDVDVTEHVVADFARSDKIIGPALSR